MNDFVVLTDVEIQARIEREKRLENHVRNLSFIIGQIIARTKHLEEARYSEKPSHTMSVSECVERLASTVATARRFILLADREINDGPEDITNSTGDSKEAK